MRRTLCRRGGGGCAYYVPSVMTLRGLGYKLGQCVLGGGVSLAALHAALVRRTCGASVSRWLVLRVDTASVFASVRAQPRGCGLMATARPTSGTESEAAGASAQHTISAPHRTSHPGHAEGAAAAPRVQSHTTLAGSPSGAANPLQYGTTHAGTKTSS